MDAFNKILILIICISSTEISASVNNHYEDSLLMQHYYEAGLGLYSEGLYSQALDSFKYAFETGKKIYSENHFNLRNINNGLGITYRNIGQYDKALEHFLLAEQSYRSDSVKNELAIARVYNNIGNVYYNKFN
ncbi:MAG: tetratricopeptide repeat protein, partial [Bacteroidales bacterium]|nr:tetratricopeptide repeat protein [Bacteroidales bacterium]